MSRNIPTTFSEGRFVSIAIISNLQILVVGVPVLIVVGSEPATSFFVRSVVVWMNDLVVVSLIFGNLIYSVSFSVEQRMGSEVQSAIQEFTKREEEDAKDQWSVVSRVMQSMKTARTATVVSNVTNGTVPSPINSPQIDFLETDSWANSDLDSTSETTDHPLEPPFSDDETDKGINKVRRKYPPILPSLLRLGNSSTDCETADSIELGFGVRTISLVEGECVMSDGLGDTIPTERSADTNRKKPRKGSWILKGRDEAVE